MLAHRQTPTNPLPQARDYCWSPFTLFVEFKRLETAPQLTSNFDTSHVLRGHCARKERLIEQGLARSALGPQVDQGADLFGQHPVECGYDYGWVWVDRSLASMDDF